MDEKSFKECARRLKEVNQVVSKLDPAIRSEAFSLLRSYVTEHKTGAPVPAGRSHTAESQAEAGDLGELIIKHSSETPAENALLAAGCWYNDYGIEPFSLDAIRKVADSGGITVPARLDMTYSQAKRKGKSLFRSAGRGRFAPTVHGESFMKTTYHLKKGTKRPPTNES
jgi:hypothetical protein